MRCYDYVTVPYDRVRALLHSDAAGIFARATATANDRVRELMATLRLNVGPVEVGVDVQLKIGAITDEVTAVGDPRTRLDFTWQAAKSAGFFPTMEATLSAYPLSPRETQLDLQGRYRPPLGHAGNGHRRHGGPSGRRGHAAPAAPRRPHGDHHRARHGIRERRSHVSTNRRPGRHGNSDREHRASRTSTAAARGVLLLVVSAVICAGLVASHVHPAWRLGLVVPLFGAALGLFQALG